MIIFNLYRASVRRSVGDKQRLFYFTLASVTGGDYMNEFDTLPFP